MSYGLSAGWVHGNWRIEANASNIFSKRRLFKTSQNVGPYNWHQAEYNRVNQQNGFVKVSYTFDFGKKTSRDNQNVNTFIDSAILKAE